MTGGVSAPPAYLGAMVSRAQLVRNHSVGPIPVAAWGSTLRHPHELSNGNGTGYTPNLAYVTSAYVNVGNENYAIDAKTVAVVAVDAVHVHFVVGDAPAGDALKEALTTVVGEPIGLTFEVMTRFAHSQEIDAAATGDETIGTLKSGLVPVELVAAAKLVKLFAGREKPTPLKAVSPTDEPSALTGRL